MSTYYSVDPTIGFKENLNCFQRKLMDDFHSDNEQLIGISIQIRDDLQDANSATRSVPGHTNDDPQKKINHFCSKVLSDNNSRNKCDSLDYHLKEMLFYLEDKTGAICNCHMGLTNVILPLKHKHVNQEITWYIIIGQFLLDDFSRVDDKSHFLKDNGLSQVDDLYDNDIRKEFVLSGGFHTKNSLLDKKKYYEDAPPTNYDLALISKEHFLNFKNNALNRFKEFLNDCYKNQKLLESIKEYILQVGIQNIVNHLKENKTFKINNDHLYKRIDSLINLITLKQEKLKDNNTMLIKLKKFAKDDKYLAGTYKWDKKCDDLIKEVKEIL